MVSLLADTKDQQACQNPSGTGPNPILGHPDNPHQLIVVNPYIYLHILK